eukprot:14165733-Alexandrium_andersonii.AAC.1
MSASLVGSEMCIRDRRWRKECPLRPLQGFRRRRSARRADLCLGNRCGAVSYTHLTLPTICSV